MDPVESAEQFIARHAALGIAEILGDVPPPAGFSRQASADGGRRIAFKTGTPYGFREAWAVGFDRLHIVDVWVGRPDGAAHLDAYGIAAAALLMQVSDALPVPDRDVRSADEDLGPLAHTEDLPSRLQGFKLPTKAGATRAADNSATDRQPMALFGWRDGKMANHYTRAADRKRLAIEAAKLLASAQTENEKRPHLGSGKGAKRDPAKIAGA